MQDEQTSTLKARIPLGVIAIAVIMFFAAFVIVYLWVKKDIFV